jgi:hypothetical protein
VELPQPYLLFLGDVTEPTYAKTAFGLRDWARERCVGEWSCCDRAVTLGLPRLSPAQAHASGARSMVIGVANIGGKIADSWLPHLLNALEAGLDVVSACTRGSATPRRSRPRRNCIGGGSSMCGRRRRTFRSRTAASAAACGC